jgi:hypothetical protein
MQCHARLLTSLAAAAMLAAAVGTASANRLSVNRGQIRVVWSQFEFSDTVTTNVVKCPVTLEGSFHNTTFVKTRTLLVGYLSRATVSNGVCTGGRATILEGTLPWHLTYSTFAGSLPFISSVTLDLIRAGFDIEIPGVNTCKAVTSNASPGRLIALIGAGSLVTGIRLDESVSIPLVNGNGGFGCSLGSGRFRGSGSITLLNSTLPFSIRLI